MRTSVEIKGIKELREELKRLESLEPVKKAVRVNSALLHQRAQAKAVFRGHMEWRKGVGLVFVKPTGFLRRSIMGPYLELSGLSGKVRAEADYAGYVEKGTRYMAAQPYMEPALREVEPLFLADLRSIFK